MSSYFVYFQLRSALKTYGVPWNSPLPAHPMLQWIAPLLGRPSVSLIYSTLIRHRAKALPIESIWNREFKYKPRLGENMVQFKHDF